MKNYTIVALAALLVFIGSSCLLAADNNAAVEALRKLNIEVIGPAEQTEEQLPDKLNGPYWGYLNNTCRDSGWDLSAYAGKKISSTCFPIQEKFGDEPLNVWVLSSAEKTVCIYKAVREGSSLVPGIFPVKNTVR